jgi:hypothetical protein
MAEIIKKIENLKPGKNYIFSVRTKNTDINAYSESVDSILVSIPKDTTIPDAISNLALYASFENVMFVFDFSNDLDIDKYEYELYDNGAGTGTATSTGFSSANVFTVAVPNSTDTVAKTYWGRVRSVDTTGNLGPWTALTQTDQSTPLIDSQYISSLTASKITAGTIGAQTITLSGANSILKSNNYAAANTTFGGTGWKISGDGKAVFNDASIRSSLDIGEDQGTSDATSFHVDSNGNMWSGSNSTSFSIAPFRVTNTGDVTANSLTLTGLTELATGGKIFLGAGNYNNMDTAFYVDATEQFSLGDKLTWDGNSLTVQGTLKLSDGSDVLDAEEAANIAQDLVDEFGNTIYEDGFIGGLTISSNTMYYGNGFFASGNTAFYVGKNSGGQANFSLGNKLTWDGATLSITGNVVITGGTTLALINDAQADADAAATAASNAQSDADAAYAYADAAFDNANNKITIGGAGISVDNNGFLTQISGDVIRTGLIASPGNTSYLDLNNGTFNFGSGAIYWNGATLSVNGDISGSSGTFGGAISGSTIDCLNITVENGYSYRAQSSFPTAGGGVGPLYAQSLGGQGVERIVRFTSLREFKENIQDMPDGLSVINNLRPRIFSWKMGEIDPVTNEPWTDQAKDLMSLNRSYGFIVEEVLEAQPELVTFQPPSHELPWDQEGGIFDINAWKPAMWNTIEIIPLLVKSVQELSAKVEELESRLNS